MGAQVLLNLLALVVAAQEPSETYLEAAQRLAGEGGEWALEWAACEQKTEKAKTLVDVTEAFEALECFSYPGDQGAEARRVLLGEGGEARLSAIASVLAELDLTSLSGRGGLLFLHRLLCEEFGVGIGVGVDLDYAEAKQISDLWSSILDAEAPSAEDVVMRASAGDMQANAVQAVLEKRATLGIEAPLSISIAAGPGFSRRVTVEGRELHRIVIPAHKPWGRLRGLGFSDFWDRATEWGLVYQESVVDFQTDEEARAWLARRKTPAMSQCARGSMIVFAAFTPTPFVTSNSSGGHVGIQLFRVLVGGQPADLEALLGPSDCRWL